MRELMTLQEVAGYLRVTEKTIYRLLERGEIPATKVGHQWRFVKASIDEWLQQKSVRARASVLVTNRKTGIDIIGDVSWGTHFCQFYQTKEDLVDILVPYFKAGLENNEFCVWVTSEPLSEKGAKEAMSKAVPDFERYLKRGQIEILPHTEWCLKDGAFNLQRVLNAGIDKLNQALAKGYDGIRVTSNTAWLEKRDWGNFADYEEQVNSVIGEYRMMAICTYSLDKCGAGEVIDVVNNHQFALIRRGGEWELIESSERKQVMEALSESETKFRSLAEQSPNMIFINKKGRVVYANKKCEEVMGYKREEFYSRDFDFTTLIAPEYRYLVKTSFNMHMRGEDVPPFEYTLLTKDGKRINTILTTALIGYGRETAILGTVTDITERKRAEEQLRQSEKRSRKAKESYERIIDNADEVILRVEPKGGHVIYANPAAERLLGYTQAEWLAGNTLGFKIIHPDFAEEQKRIIEEINTTKKQLKTLSLAG